MWIVHSLGLLAVAWLGQAVDLPPYVERGNQVAQRFVEYRAALDAFRVELRQSVAADAPGLLPALDAEDPPPQPGVYGYQLLPAIVDEAESARRRSISTFAYSWSITEGYIEAEAQKLGGVRTRLARVEEAEPTGRREPLSALIEQYRDLVDNLETIDQYLQYNRFWQRAIAEDRGRFDRMTEFYDLLVSGTPGAADAVREYLGPPAVPAFIDVDDSIPQLTVVRLPVYTDIPDDVFLAHVESGVERMWRVTRMNGPSYMLDLEFRRLSPDNVYGSEAVPSAGAHIDLTDHRRRFPGDGALLTTGAESTYGLVGEYVALGPGEITVRTLAHEFGHVIGYADGYIRGYRDLGDAGFEILELTSTFDDIMTAPREGRVLARHFELVLQAIDRR